MPPLTPPQQAVTASGKVVTHQELRGDIFQMLLVKKKWHLGMYTLLMMVNMLPLYVGMYEKGKGMCTADV